MTSRSHPSSGFTLIEVVVAMMLLLVGAFALHGAITVAARKVTGSQEQFIASQRAAEAIESVFKARDNRVLTWAQIRNAIGADNDGGIFLDGPQNVREPGADGLVNTADDAALAEVVKPGNDGLLGTGDDVHQELFGFTREIEIRDVGPTLRRLRVIVRFRTAHGPGQFVLVTYVSQYA